MILVRAGLVLGLIIWGAATTIFVLLGHFVFGPDNRVPVAVSASLIVVATFFGVSWLAMGILRREHASGLERGALLGVFICLPGLILDGALYAFNSNQYPGLEAPASGAMSAGLLFAYAAALMGSLNGARALARRT